MQYKSERVEQLIQKALDTTAKDDPKAFGTVSHTAAIEQERKSEKDATTRLQRASRVEKSLHAYTKLEANNNNNKGRG